MWFRRKKPKWLVKNTHTLKYAGKEGGWVSRKEHAKRFDDFEGARYVSLVLTISEFNLYSESGPCIVTQDL